ncbi:MAG TPA: ligase-associated DNA damage response exonuclease [Steroidobacteraceae bacterium]|nr:ligase-associated DNA damage response exonuclease [Steroidobacteraceae bacterium]
MNNGPELLVTTPRGLYCPPGDFYIDPLQPVQTAVVTHGHGDHLHPGHARYILARPGEGIARARLTGRPEIVPLDYGASVALGAASISLHPAGHILGSAQIRIEHQGTVWVVSGDYKRQPDPTCASFEPLTCDVFVTESTFGLPVYRWPPTTSVIGQILLWWRSNAERGLASVLFCYSLGKAQRLLAELAPHTAAPVYVHGAMSDLIAIYRTAGISMAPTAPATEHHKEAYRGALVLAPPNSVGTSWVRRVGPYSSGFCSGWMRVRGERRRRGYHRGFVMSDHADWPALVATCRQTRASRVLTMHGHTEALARYLTEEGIEARPLAGSSSSSPPSDASLQ